MAKYNKLIFVSTSNVSRSPMAEAIYKGLDDGTQMEVISRGLVVLFEEPGSMKAEAVLNNHKLSMGEHVSRQLMESDIDVNTLVITMSERQKVLEQFELQKDFMQETVAANIEKYRKGDAVVTVTDEAGNPLKDAEGKPIIRRLAGTNSGERNADYIYADDNDDNMYELILYKNKLPNEKRENRDGGNFTVGFLFFVIFQRIS